MPNVIAKRIVAFSGGGADAAISIPEGVTSFMIKNTGASNALITFDTGVFTLAAGEEFSANNGGDVYVGGYAIDWTLTTVKGTYTL